MNTPCPGCQYEDTTLPRCTEGHDRPCLMGVVCMPSVCKREISRLSPVPSAPAAEGDLQSIVIRFIDPEDVAVLEKLRALSDDLPADLLAVLHLMAAGELQRTEGD